MARGVTYVTIRGDHDAMLLGPGTADLVKGLLAALERGERASSNDSFA
jgi:hypothetical protein